MSAPLWSTVEVEWLINRMHVSATDDEVRHEIERRATSWPVEARAEAVAYALAHHATNRGTYVNVMRGTR